jgi:hypothetical protein
MFMNTAQSITASIYDVDDWRHVGGVNVMKFYRFNALVSAAVSPGVAVYATTADF